MNITSSVREKIQAAAKKYPGLLDFKVEDVCDFRVQRLGHAELEKPVVAEIGTEQSLYSEKIEVCIYDSSDRCVATVEEGMAHVDAREMAMDTRGGTIAQTIHDHDLAGELAYVVWREYHSASYTGQPEQETLTLYLPPKRGMEAILRERELQAEEVIERVTKEAQVQTIESAFGIDSIGPTYVLSPKLEAEDLGTVRIMAAAARSVCPSGPTFDAGAFARDLKSAGLKLRALDRRPGIGVPWNFDTFVIEPDTEEREPALAHDGSEPLTDSTSTR